MLKGIVWDFDGTIVDTETPQFEAWDAVFREHGTQLDYGLWSRMVGTETDWDLLSVLEERVGPVNRITLGPHLNQLIHERLKAAPLRRGVRRLMEAADKIGVIQAIASSSGRRWIHEYSNRHQLTYIRAVASGDEVARVKPDPALYHLAVSRLGFRADECAAFEDSPHGAAAAITAGLCCVVVPNPSTQTLAFPTGVIRRASYEEITLDEVAKWVG
jgi:HAD superfamily hydrolase (TIGR01509 family)